MEKIDLLTLVLLIVAVVVILKLRSVLGRRTGDEEARLERYRAERRQQSAPATPPPAADNNVITVPRREQPATAPVAEASVAPDAETRIKDYPGLKEDVRRGLLDIVKVDPGFDTDAFIRGASQAYEMIVTAFAEGNRKILKDLLDTRCLRDFDNAITERETRGEQIDQSFVGIEQGRYPRVRPEGRHRPRHRALCQPADLGDARQGRHRLSGDPQKLKEVTDIWTFSATSRRRRRARTRTGS